MLVSIGEGLAHVKSPVASACLFCSSVKKRVRVTMSVLMCSSWVVLALEDMLRRQNRRRRAGEIEVYEELETGCAPDLRLGLDRRGAGAVEYLRYFGIRTQKDEGKIARQERRDCGIRAQERRGTSLVRLWVLEDDCITMSSRDHFFTLAFSSCPFSPACRGACCCG